MYLGNVEELYTLYQRELLDWAETDTKVKNLARPILGDWVDGDSMGVPQVDDIVEKLISRIKTMEAEADIIRIRTLTQYWEPI